jgi:hypothetical protein
MSTLSVHDLQGISAHSNTVRIPSGHKLSVEGEIAIPALTAAQLRAAPGSVVGQIAFNTSINQVSTWDGTSWSGTQDGSSQAAAAASAKEIYDNGFVTAGKMYRWITTPNGGAKEVWCDFDTKDQFGNSGWMLVGAFEQGWRWGGGNSSGVTTTASTIAPSSSQYAISSNFGDFDMNMFRITGADSVTGGNISQYYDFYYKWDTAIMWKEVWKPDAGAGSGGRYYLSDGNNPANVYRCSLRKFQGSFNIKYNYFNANHRFNNLSDYGYQNTKTTITDYSYGIIGEGVAPVAGFFDVWTALTSPGYRFEWFYVGRSATYSSRTGGDQDGSLAIPQQGANTDATGQDIDGNISVKVGHDDGTAWGAVGQSATDNTGNNGYENKTMWWWIK